MELSLWPKVLFDSLRRLAGALLAPALFAVSLVPLSRCLSSAVARIGYPFDLEWMESGVVSHVRAILSGRPIYAAPSLEFTAFIYPPLYYYASAAVSLVVGVGHVAPRLVSLLSIVGCFVLIGVWVRDLTEDALAGLAGSAAFSATYGITDYWFDLARVDSFFLVLLLGGVHLLRTAGTARRVAAGSALLAAACFTKQMGGPLGAVAVAWLFIGQRRFALTGTLVYAGALAGLFALFAFTSHGWFQFYVLEVPSRHRVEWFRGPELASTFLFGPVAALVIAQAAFVCRVGVGRTKDRDWLLLTALGLTAGATSLLSLMKVGGFPNGFMPAYALFAVAFGVELAALRAASPRAEFGKRLFALVALTVHCALLWYRVGAEPPNLAKGTRTPVPTAVDLEVGMNAVRVMRGLPRPLWVTASSDLPRLAGQEAMVTHTIGLIDIMAAGGEPAFSVHAALLEAIVAHRFRTIVVDRPVGFLPVELLYVIKQNYRAAGTVVPGAPAGAFLQRGGAWLRPEDIWVWP